jgi:glyoxylase-like metal-dependent hydrolase (beta-lactamase superfamily II)/ferredoxin|tara:strand:- start:11826 stop:12740 length:915 start_codon:yes stop_codon:yes gene_type:complete
VWGLNAVAKSSLRLAENVEGNFFVDRTCIDCSTCNWLAPESFSGAASFSFVQRQPSSPAAIRQAQKALISCPVGAIGTEQKTSIDNELRFPDLISENVFHCGYHSESSFGATSYFIQREAGNVMVDSPRFAGALVKQIEQMGGLDIMFLTHRDDIADHQKFADHFGCERFIHVEDAVSSARSVEHKIAGGEPFEIDDELLVLPVPGHTRGSACLLYRESFLFTGDHLAWNIDAQNLRAFRTACWYDWSIQTISMTTLQNYTFEWVLPGHGRRINLPTAEMRKSLEKCIKWMGKTGSGTAIEQVS